MHQRTENEIWGKFYASIREAQNGYLTFDNVDGEYVWKDAKSAFKHIQKCHDDFVKGRA